MTVNSTGSGVDTASDKSEYDDEGVSLGEMLAPLARHWQLWLGGTLLAGALGAGGSYLITPVFTSTTTFLPPQQRQSVASSALASLGALAGIVGGGAGKSPADEYVSLMQSVTVTDRIVDRFKLVELYHAKYRRDARRDLADSTVIVIGKKDGLISVSVDDVEPARAAAIANQYVEELRRMTTVLAVSEAQQRRMFFEKQVQDTNVHLIAAQSALQDSGFSAGAMKAEPRAASDEYARLRAEMTTAEVRLQTLRNSLTETTPQVQEQTAKLQALRTKVTQLEQSSAAPSADQDYVSKYREFKYQEKLFELMAQQYELARVDESREGALIQVVDPALPAEVKSKPKRALMAIGTALAGAMLIAIALIARDRRRKAAPSPAQVG